MITSTEFPFTDPKIWIGLGSNLGHSLTHLSEARCELSKDLEILGISSLYSSAPIDCPEPQNDYLNAVICATSYLKPLELLKLLLNIEQKHGRQRLGYHDARTLDLDILLYGNQQWADTTLTLPHPALYQRAFVLAPMNEIAPTLLLPNDDTVAHALSKVADQQISLFENSMWQPLFFKSNANHLSI
ncbi:MAG: 2-amino-4-hydroxy-6-hydroxymethyldihydropteridine diphosphokinase [Pseudomonadota bacterium]